MSGSFLLHSDDLGETEAVLRANFAEIRIDAKGDKSSTRARIWRRSVGSFTVDEAQFGYDFEYDMEPPDDILLCRVRSGVLEERLTNQDTAVGPNKVVAFGALSDVPYSGSVQRAVYDVVTLDRGFLGEVAGDPSVRLTSSSPINGDANRLLVDAVDYVRRGIVANPNAVQEDLIAGPLGRYLAACVLSAIPHTSSSTPGARGDQDIGRVRLRRAIAFIDDHADTDISLADIATAAGTTPGSLRYTFSRYRDCAPMEYVHRVRMNHVHSEIEAGLGASETVAEVARRWGFADVDRFAVEYHQTYGRRPSVLGPQTLPVAGEH